jgi:hypothetical protein
MARVVTSLPEFINGTKHLRAGEWASAVSSLEVVATIAKSANLPDHKQLNGFLGVGYFYAGNFSAATKAFQPDYPHFAAAADLEQKFPRPREMLGVMPPTESENLFFERFRSFQKNPTLDSFRSIPPTCDFQELAALAQASLTLAHRIPEAAGQALADAEELGRSGPEGKTLAPWFIAHSLLVHGRVAVTSGQALLAEALFQAAKERAVDISSLARREVCEYRCDKAMGELLLKWEKREDRGASILESISGKFDLNEIADASEMFLPPPSLSLI